jgi:large subunit ribosomal protein L3
MTQLFVEGERLMPVTVIEAGPCAIVQVRTVDRDGYEAAQIGFLDLDESRVNLPMEGHFKKAKVDPKRHLAEVPLDGEMKTGDVLKADVFSEGQRVDVVGVSKGKGFAGVVKRHNFRGGPGGHGSHFHRAPGSVGACATPSRIHKGMKMAGQMGNARVTVQNLQIVRIDADQNLVMLKGAIPGGKGAVVMIKETCKVPK